MQNPEISDLLWHGPVKRIHVVPVTEDQILIGWCFVAVFEDGYQITLSEAQQEYLKNHDLRPN